MAVLRVLMLPKRVVCSWEMFTLRVDQPITTVEKYIIHLKYHENILGEKTL